MTDVNGAWTADQLETFLTESVIPVRLGCHHPSGGLWMLSLWFDYQENAFRCATSNDSDLASFLRRNDDVAFEVSTNQPPYMGVRGKGTASLEPDEDKEVLRRLLHRYFGGTESELARALLKDERDELALTVEPDRLYTWDFADRMGSALAKSPAHNPEPKSPRYRD